MKVCFICKYCGELVNEPGEGIEFIDLTLEDGEDIIEGNYHKGILIKTICKDCLADFGYTDEDFSSWLNGVNILRH